MVIHIFDKAYTKENVSFIGSVRIQPGKPLVVPPSQIKQLLDREDCHKRGNLKVLRFLLKTDGELVFAAEGPPANHIPAHWQMTGSDDAYSACCITAGNAFFDENNVLVCLDHKSGDFRPEFDSLKFALPEFVKAGIPIAEKLIS